ncbi:tetratricopeptide repeat protein [Planctomycetota bacterium]
MAGRRGTNGRSLGPLVVLALAGAVAVFSGCQATPLKDAKESFETAVEGRPSQAEKLAKKYAREAKRPAKDWRRRRDILLLRQYGFRRNDMLRGLVDADYDKVWKSFREAEHTVNIVLERDPTDEYGLLCLGYLQTMMADRFLAEESEDLAEEYFEAASTTFANALDSHEASAELHFFRAVMSTMRQKPEAALEDYEKASRLGYERPDELYAWWGMAYLATLDQDNARGIWSECQKLEPSPFTEWVDSATAFLD